MISIIFHGIIIMGIIFTLPKKNISVPPKPIITVEFAREDEAPTRKKDIAKKAEKTKEARKIIEANPTPPQEAKKNLPPAPTPQPEPKPKMVKTDDAIVIEKKPKAPPTPPKNETPQIATPKPVSSPAPSPRPPMRPSSVPELIDTASILKNIEKLKASNISEGKSLENQAREAIKKASKIKDENTTIAEKDTIKADEIEALRRQIMGCWSIPSGIKNIEQYKVDIQISLDPLGHVNKTTLLDGTPKNKPYYRVFVESAERAVQLCSPLKLPLKKYELWKEIIFTFDPKNL